ncbi:MAG: hypothetical protein UR81_C0005G0002 [Candidatus Levybacteria bacterium GW2011_GWB1_35_5]|nr:MAG: hypothetical protein UR81_C0005G0002 [Candidatus Levybacteria bacterium GW2011_GWB1_35_5]
MNDLILKLYSSSQTVFQIEEIAQMFPDVSPNNLTRRLHYFVSVAKIKNPRRGIYTKMEYLPFELANKIFTPSYISFETVLLKEGIVFQYYETIFVASYLSRTLTVDNHAICYRQIGDHALYNRSGIEEKNGYFIATKERAFLDAVFLYKDYYFDNLGSLDWEKIFKLEPVYQSKALFKRVKNYHKHFKEEYGAK